MSWTTTAIGGQLRAQFPYSFKGALRGLRPPLTAALLPVHRPVPSYAPRGHLDPQWRATLLSLVSPSFGARELNSGHQVQLARE
jgi:hypothetical protein